MHAPMLIPLLGVVTGILLSVAGVPIWVSVFLALLGSVIYYFFLRYGSNPIKGIKINKYHYIWLFSIFCAIGLFDSWLNKPELIKSPEQAALVKGSIIELSNSTTGDRAVIDVSEIINKSGEQKLIDNTKIIIRSDVVEAKIGDEIIFPVELSPIGKSDNYFSSGYAEYLRRKGIYFETYTKGNEIQVISNPFSFQGLAAEMKDNLETIFEHTELNKKTQNFLITILIGDRVYLDNDLRIIFSDAGLSHILALSGMHIAIIGGILFFLLFPLNFCGKYKLRYAITGILLFLYAFITGWNPSTVRATIMMAAVILCIILERKNTAWNSLLLASFIILLVSPYAIFDIGLQLSFICVASLIFFVRPLNPFEQHSHPELYKFGNMIIACFVTTLATWCICAYYFNIIPVSFLTANLVILPFLPVYLVLSIIYIFFSHIGYNIDFLRVIIDSGYEYLFSFVRYITSEGTSSIAFRPSLITVIIWLILIVSLALWINAKKKNIYRWQSLILIGIFIISVSFTSDAEEEEGYIVRRENGNITILCKIKEKENLYQIKRGSVSKIIIDGHSLIIVDCPIDGLKDNAVKCDELILAGGCKNDMSEIIQKFDAGKIIIHPSVRKKKEIEIINSADSLGISCHSIRNSGAYKYLLTD